MPASLTELDQQLLDLMLRRLALVRDQAAHQATGQPTNRSLAEAQAEMRRFVRAQTIDAGIPVEMIEDLMRHVVSLSHRLHRQYRIAYLGPLYSYSHLAATGFFGGGAELVPVATIPAVFESIVRGDCAAGVVPIENSTDGRVVDTLGMFLKHRVRIRGELLLPIHHNLLSRSPRAEIVEVASKPQALSQCRSWLAQHLPDARLIEISSTAAAAKLAAEKPGVAAIASVEAGEQYGLETLAESIEDNPNNVTRFAILGSEPTSPTGNDKTALLFQVAHQPGALADAMNLFKHANLNLTWIESFPLPGSKNEYLFFIELEGHETDAGVAKVIGNLSKQAQRLETLGSYARHAVSQS